MRSVLLMILLVLVTGCFPVWNEPPYQVYWIDGSKILGFSLGEGSLSRRVTEPNVISSNAKYISVYACPNRVCSYFYIDKINDHQFAEREQVVFGPYNKAQFVDLEASLGLPALAVE